MATTETWSEPNQCPFCEATLASPGAGFVDHLRENGECAAAFERWRGNVADDMAGCWAG